MQIRTKAFISLLVAAIAPNASVQAQKETGPIISSWRDLTPTKELGGNAAASYFETTAPNGCKVFIAVMDAKGGKAYLKPIFNEISCPTSKAARTKTSLVAVNGGFFNLSNGESTSYVVIDGKQVCEPRHNKALTSNPKLAPYLETIFNRSELRILKDEKNKIKLTVARHNDPVPAGWSLSDSLQAGPRLLPELGDKDEAFVRKDPDGTQVDSIGSHRSAARTAVGITADGHAMLVCVPGSKQDEFSSGMTLRELSSLLAHLGCVEALNLDGGTSTTMVIRENSPEAPCAYRMVCGRAPETQVKTALAIQANSRCGMPDQ